LVGGLDDFQYSLMRAKPPAFTKASKLLQYLTFLTWKNMNLVILSPEKQIFAGAVKSVKVPGATGFFEMLENHAPIVSSLQAGEVRIIKEDGEKIAFQVNGGFVEMLNNEVSLLIAGVQE
jgi:F-type H+-transporting ATPase subunit epsilon